MSFITKICNYLKFTREELEDKLATLIPSAIIVICVIIMYRDKPKPPLEASKFGDLNHGVFSEDRLAKFNGITEENLYLAVLGSVFDVSKGAKYYAKGGSYNYFVGKDGSRALITGDFTDESENKDNVIDLSCADIFNLLNWKATFQEKYTHVGVVKGRYYDKNGKETIYYKELLHRINQCEEDKKASKQQERKYPPCNIAWNADDGSKVWCTRTSGGVSRDWIGVPRQLYMPGQEKPLCVCVNLDKEKVIGQFKEYDGCPNNAYSCTVDIS